MLWVCVNNTHKNAHTDKSTIVNCDNNTNDIVLEIFLNRSNSWALCKYSFERTHSDHIVHLQNLFNSTCARLTLMMHATTRLITFPAKATSTSLIHYGQRRSWFIKLHNLKLFWSTVQSSSLVGYGPRWKIWNLPIVFKLYGGGVDSSVWLFLEDVVCDALELYFTIVTAVFLYIAYTHWY